MLRSIKVFLIPIILLFTSSTLNTGCDIDELATSIGEANEVIKQGIDKIIANSEDWQNIVKYDILPFIDQKLDWLVADLNALVEKTAQEIQANAACIADRADDRVLNGLKTILSDLDGMRRHQFVMPYVCSASPSVLKLDLPEGHRDNIQVSGFDFLDKKELQLFLRKNGVETQIVQDRVAKTSNYLLQINAGNWDSTLKKYDYLVLRYNGIQLTEIPIHP